MAESDLDEKPRRYPKPSVWAEAEALWATGDVTLQELAEFVGVSTTSVSLHMKQKNISKGEKAEERRKKIAEKVESSSLGSISEHSARIKETKDEHYNMSKGIALLTWKTIKDAQTSGTPFGAIQPHLKSLEIAMNVLTKAQQSRWQVLGLDRPDAVDSEDLPDLVISELTAEEMEALRERTFNDPLDLEIDGEEFAETKGAGDQPPLG